MFVEILNNHLVKVKCDSFAPPVLTLQMFYLQEEMGWLYTIILNINIWYSCILEVIWSLFWKPNTWYKYVLT